MHKDTTVAIHAEMFPDRTYNGRKFVNATSVARGPIVANASSITAAKELFAQAVGDMLDTWQRPTIIAFGGYVGLVYPVLGMDRVSWEYRIVSPDGTVGCSTQMGENAERSCRGHLAQYVTDYHDDASVIASMAVLADDDQRAEHLRYTAWQRARRAADKLCPTGDDPHRWAGDHANDYALTGL